MLTDKRHPEEGPSGNKKRRLRKTNDGRVKLADVAKHAGVSTATASRAINNPGLVSANSREKVETAISALSWIPHGAAKALASLRTRTIGAIIPTFGHQGIAGMVEALQGALAEADYTLLMGWSGGVPETATRQALDMIQRGIDCLILMGEDQPVALMRVLEERRIFYVIAYTSGRRGFRNCIGFDNFLEMSKLTGYLLSLGHTRFGIITRGYAHNDRIQQRIEGVQVTLAEASLAVRPQHLIEVSHWLIGSGRKGMRQILSRQPVPTAVICTNDYLAAGALIEAKASGFSVPAEISVVGFDDIELAGELDPPLTTIRVPARRIGQELAGFILGMLENGGAELPPRLDAELVLRGTTGPPRNH